MTGTAADVIRVAKSQVGYHEGYSGGHWTNLQKYSPAVPGLEWSQNQAWCATFASWCFQEAGMPKGSYPVTASCELGVAWWKQQNRFSEYPAIGAQVFFGVGGGSHTGIVYAYDATYIYTVEGNTNDSGSAEGDGVYLKKRARRDAYVYGYGYPAYPGGIVTADPNWKNPTPAPPPEEHIVADASDVKTLFQTDDVLSSPDGDKDPQGNKFWTAESYLRYGYLQDRTTQALVKQLAAKVDTQGQTIDQLVKTVATLAAGVGGLDPTAIVTELKAAIESITVHLDVPNS